MRRYEERKKNICIIEDSDVGILFLVCFFSLQNKLSWICKYKREKRNGPKKKEEGGGREGLVETHNPLHPIFIRATIPPVTPILWNLDVFPNSSVRANL
jgi:hypothetical protein